MDKEEPLVSVFVVTYNSQDYIIEALESVKSQTYHNIELIVSDDCSSDRTVVKVKEWIDKNQARFVRTELIKSPVNTGIPANYNRAVMACNGEWLKMVDGDDVLLENCISDNVEFVKRNKEADVIFSNGYSFNNKGKKLSQLYHESDIHFFSLDASQQIRILLKENFISSISCFINAKLLKENKYDERYVLLEDYPMWVRLSKLGHVFYFLNKYTVMYRKVDSVSSRNNLFFPVLYTDCKRQFFYNELMPLIRYYRDDEAYNNNRRCFLLYDLCELILRNKRNNLTIFVYGIIKLVIYKFCFFKLSL